MTTFISPIWIRSAKNLLSIGDDNRLLVSNIIFEVERMKFE